MLPAPAAALGERLLSLPTDATLQGSQLRQHLMPQFHDDTIEVAFLATYFRQTYCIFVVLCLADALIRVPLSTGLTTLTFSIVSFVVSVVVISVRVCIHSMVDHRSAHTWGLRLWVASIAVPPFLWWVLPHHTPTIVGDTMPLVIAVAMIVWGAGFGIIGAGPRAKLLGLLTILIALYGLGGDFTVEVRVLWSLFLLGAYSAAHAYELTQRAAYAVGRTAAFAQEAAAQAQSAQARLANLNRLNFESQNELKVAEARVFQLTSERDATAKSAAAALSAADLRLFNLNHENAVAVTNVAEARRHVQVLLEQRARLDEERSTLLELLESGGRLQTREAQNQLR